MKRAILLFVIILLFIPSVIVWAAEETTPSGIPYSQMESKIDNYVNKNLGKTTPGVAVAVVKDGKIIFSKGYGYADVENKVSVSSNTVFEYGSISKLFVWTSVMQLVEEGKLDLDADIRTYLSDDFNKKWNYKQTITMRDIMNHSAGFGDYAFDLIFTDPNSVISLEDSLLIAHPKQYYKQGKASAYSNYATALAGYVVECISGEKFSDYELKHIMKPIGMLDSYGSY